MPWLNSTDKKMQAFHWNPLAEISELSFIGEDGSLEYTNYIDFQSLSGSKRTTTKIKFNMTTLYDNNDTVITYNIWFADSPEKLKQLVASGTPTKIIGTSWGFNLPVIMTFDITTRYMAINYDSGQSSFNPSQTSLSIYAY
jgi:hypothetical protein